MTLDLNSDNIAEAVMTRIKGSSVLIPRLLTLAQAAVYLGLTQAALKAKARMGSIPTVEIDRKLRFDRHDLDRIIDESKKID